jgi:hypothetical protein
MVFMGRIGNTPGADMVENIGIRSYLAVQTSILHSTLQVSYYQDILGELGGKAIYLVRRVRNITCTLERKQMLLKPCHS